MKRFLALVVAAVACLSTACATIRPPRTTHIVSQIRMEVHADTTFNEHERALIRTAVGTMKRQTGGFLEFIVIFDLDFDSMVSLQENASSNTLTKVHSTAKDMDKDTIGYCIVNYNDLTFRNPTKAALVYDRLSTNAAWIHVTMHEMLHMVRLQHISTARTILFKSTPVVGNSIVTCMTKDDIEELCTVHGCNPVAMSPCSP